MIKETELLHRLAMLVVRYDIKAAWDIYLAKEEMSQVILSTLFRKQRPQD